MITGSEPLGTTVAIQGLEGSDRGTSVGNSFENRKGKTIIGNFLQDFQERGISRV